MRSIGQDKVISLSSQLIGKVKRCDATDSILSSLSSLAASTCVLFTQHTCVLQTALPPWQSLECRAQTASCDHMPMVLEHQPHRL